MAVVNTNTNALFAQNALKVNNRNLSTAMEQLSTGSRINSAKDDAAGMAIASTMTAQIGGLNQAVRNANDAISMLQTAEGGMNDISNMLQRMRELAVQAATGTYSSEQTGYLNTEFVALSTQIANIASQTTWNGTNILDGTASSVTIQVGATADTTLTVSVADSSASTLSVSGVTISSTSDASDAMSTINAALDTLNSARATIGASINQLTYAADNMTSTVQNYAASRSQIADTDYATATSNMARAQIIQQAATAMLAQANQTPQYVLALLK